jgi:hypothetical protein
MTDLTSSTIPCTTLGIDVSGREERAGPRIACPYFKIVSAVRFVRYAAGGWTSNA